MKKKKKKFKVKKFRLLILVCICFIAIYFLLFNKNILKRIDYSNFANITYYDIYGIHMNFKGNIKITDDVSDLKLILTNGFNETIIPWKINKNRNKYTFYTSKKINEGINLEKLDKGNYYLLIKGTLKNDEYVYYSLKNKTEYNDLEYYTLTKNGKNNKIDINWDKFNNNSILNFKIKETVLPDDVYDITIDPGHDYNDSGKLVCSDGSIVTSTGKCTTGKLYKESDLNLALAKELKKELENYGFKVIMTRNSKEDVVSSYGKMGSATTANDTKSKFNLAIHHNSSGVTGGLSSLSGLELYVANDINFDLSNLFVNNIIKYADTKVSSKTEFKVKKGIYQRFFTAEEIAFDNYNIPNKTTNTIYYYFIREVGGIATNAYNDGSFSNLEANQHYNSNNTAESYLFELGYIDNVKELKNIINNRSGYAKGIASALYEYLQNE